MVKEKKKEDLIKSIGELKHEITSLKNSIGSYKSANTKYRAELGLYVKYKYAVEDFNNLPWYKRIFAKKIVVE